ncbi:MAG: hypothetical protein WBW74_11070, partial [Xanthobacteraceae bacterium]
AWLAASRQNAQNPTARGATVRRSRLPEPIMRRDLWGNFLSATEFIVIGTQSKSGKVAQSDTYG